MSLPAYVHRARTFPGYRKLETLIQPYPNPSAEEDRTGALC